MPATTESISLRRRLTLELLFLVILISGSVAVLYEMERSRDRAAELARVDAALQSLALDSFLNRFRALPQILSKEPAVMQAVQARNVEPLDQRGLQTTYLSGAWGVGFFDPLGEMISWVDRGDDQPRFESVPDSLVQPAIQQRLGRWYSSDLPTQYAFASGVGRDGGVLVVVDLSEIQDQWGILDHPVAVTDSAGQVVLSNRPQWLGDSLPELSGWQVSRQALPAMGWELHSITRPSYNGIWVVVALSVTIGMLLSLALSRFFRRQLAALQEERQQRATALRLERLVNQRTQALTRAQEAQIQTAKLAAIGQMSTTLTHEYNQPIATIQTYAANAQRFAAMGQIDSVEQNLAHILKQAERMGALSKTLLSFARRPQADLDLIDWRDPLNEALILLKHRIDQQGVTIEVEGSDQPVWAGPIRLTQVFVNLLTNALDALHDHPEPRIQIQARFEQSVILRFSDNGPGLSHTLAGQVFEPFVTTKPAGSGLGLGLALVRDLMRQFEGDIEWLPDADGACFELTFAARAPQDSR